MADPKAPWEKPQAAGPAVPVFPLRGTALLPGTPHLFEIAREKSIQAVNHAWTKKTKILCITQRNDDAYDPGASDLWPAGTLATVQAVNRLPSAALKTTVLGERRVWLRTFIPGETFHTAGFDPMQEEAVKPQAAALIRSLRESFEAWAMKQKTIETPFATIMVPAAAIAHMKAITDPAKLVDVVASFLPLLGGAKQRILELPNPLHRMEYLVDKLQAVLAPPPGMR